MLVQADQQVAGGAKKIHFLHHAQASLGIWGGCWFLVIEHLQVQLLGAQHEGGHAAALGIVHGNPAQGALAPTLRHGRLHHQRLTQKFCGQRVCRAQVQVSGRTGLHQLAVSHDGDLVCKRQGLALVVGDQNGGDAGLVEQLGHRFAGGRAQASVEGRERLVHQHQLGALRQGAGQRHALLLSTGEFMRAACEHGAVQRHHVHQFFNAVLALRVMAGQAKSHVVGNAQVGKQRAFLGHITNTAPMGWHNGGGVGQQFTVKHQLAGIWRFKARQNSEQGGFARARRAHDGGVAAFFNRQRDAAQCLHRAIGFAHCADV